MTLPALSLLPLILALSSPATSQELLVPAEVVDIHDGDTFVADAKPWPGSNHSCLGPARWRGHPGT